jgi:tetratricopeptide (TPR) repeat protein
MLMQLPKRYPGQTFPAELVQVGAPLFAGGNPPCILYVTVGPGPTVLIDPPGGAVCELVDATAAERAALESAGYFLPDTADPDAHYDRGCEHLAGGRLEEAVAAFTRAIALRPDDAGAYFNRGYAHAVRLRRAGWQRVEGADGTALFAGDEAATDAARRATADFTRALELDPRKAAAFGMRAEMHWVTGQTALAEADTRAAAAHGDRAAAESLRTRFGGK